MGARLVCHEQFVIWCKTTVQPGIAALRSQVLDFFWLIRSPPAPWCAEMMKVVVRGYPMVLPHSSQRVKLNLTHI